MASENAEQCSICFDRKVDDNYEWLCDHKFCSECMNQYITTKIESGHSTQRELFCCPSAYCTREITGPEVKWWTSDDTYSLFLHRHESLERVQNCFSCTQRLEFCCISATRNWFVLKCTNSQCSSSTSWFESTKYCVYCREQVALNGLFHKCKQETLGFVNRNSGNVVTSNVPFDTSIQDYMNHVGKKSLKCCPGCFSVAEKTLGCSRVRCHCGCSFCWDCLQMSRGHDSSECKRQSFGFWFVPRPFTWIFSPFFAAALVSCIVLYYVGVIAFVLPLVVICPYLEVQRRSKVFSEKRDFALRESIVRNGIVLYISGNRAKVDKLIASATRAGLDTVKARAVSDQEREQGNLGVFFGTVGQTAALVTVRHGAPKEVSLLQPVTDNTRMTRCFRWLNELLGISRKQELLRLRNHKYSVNDSRAALSKRMWHLKAGSPSRYTYLKVDKRDTRMSSNLQDRCALIAILEAVEHVNLS